MSFKTEQEEFWAGQFGSDYIERNNTNQLVSSNIALFSKVLARTTDVKSLIEFGANVGLNLQALRQLKPELEFSAIEINATATAALEKRGGIQIYNQSILDFEPDESRDLALIKGVLIHINPEFLSQVYDKLYRASRRYICMVEYYNPTPVEVDYRGHAGRLFKRDFAGDMLDRYADLQLLDYGFLYHRDHNFPNGDATWFLLEKR